MNDYFSITAANGFHDILKEQLPHPLQRAIMPIIMDRGGRPEVVGTAFAIGHRIALTAAHTFVTDGEQQGDALRLLYIYGGGAKGELHGGELPVERFTYANDTDLAIMRFKMPIVVETNEEMTHKSLQLSFGGPHIGDECHAIAYAPEFAVEDVGAVPTFTLTPHLQFSPGEVLDIYPKGRGPLLPGPGFLTDAQFDGGMSGGPILVAETVPGIPRVIGIVTAGRERLDADVPVTSYGSLIWRAASLSLPFLDEATGVEREYTLLDMADAGLISIHARERVRIVVRDDGTQSLQYAGPTPRP